MKCKKCGHNQFIANQVAYDEILVDETGDFIEVIRTVDAEKPEGPYTCANCGEEYEDLD